MTRSENSPPLPLPPGILDPDDEAIAPLILSNEQRKALLGKLAEFELMLLGLPPFKQAFVLFYLSDPSNASAAARKAGYTGNVALRGNKLLKEPKIAACIALGQNVREDRTFISSDRTLHELAVLAFSNIGDYTVGPGGRVTLAEGVPEYALRAVASADYTMTEIDDGEKVTRTHKTRIKLWSKTEALRMLAMYQKLLSGEAGINISVTNDNRGQTHTHNYQKNEWQWGNRTIRF